MRIAYGAKILALLFASLVIAAPMADATTPEANSVEDAKEAANDAVVEGVHENHAVHEPFQMQHKPRIGNLGVRQTWNQCVGMDAEEAIELIKKERPDLKNVVKVYEGMMVTMEIRMDRVRVFCNRGNIVTRPPRVG